ILHLPLLHAAAAEDEIKEHPEQGDDNDEDGPSGLPPARQVFAAEQVHEHGYEQPDPDEEQEEPEHGPKDVQQRVVTGKHGHGYPFSGTCVARATDLGSWST